MTGEFELVEAPNFTEEENVKGKLFPKGSSAEDDSTRYSQSLGEDSTVFTGYYKETGNLNFDTSIESSEGLNYSESCDTYQSSFDTYQPSHVESLKTSYEGYKSYSGGYKPNYDSIDSSSSLYNRPETPYNKFLERLKHPSCADIVSAIKGLVVMLPGNMARPEVANIAHNFIDIYTPKLLSLEIFAKLTDEERNETVECLEKFTMQKLYPLCYRMDPMDAVEDEKLEIQMLCLNWIEPHHLEINTMGDVNVLKEAQSQLKSLYKYKSPRDKLIIILNFCRLVVFSIQKISNKDVSCDEAFPLLILTIILTNPTQLHSSIEFIQHFRHPSRHISEEAYAFTLLVSAVEFIKEIGTTAKLKINQDDFREKYEHYRDKHQSRLSQLNQITSTASSSTATTTTTSLKRDGTNLMDNLKKFNLSSLFKVTLFKSDNNDLIDVVESLEYLQGYLEDLPLSYKYKEGSNDSIDLINDWRALVAMKQHAIDTILKIKLKVQSLT